MKKELADFIATEDGKKELIEKGWTQETSKAPELEKAKSDIEALKADLAKAQETSKALEEKVKTIDTLTAENEKLKKDNDILLKAKTTKPNIDAENLKTIKQITAQDFAKMSNAERVELRTINPQLYEKLSEGK